MDAFFSVVLYAVTVVLLGVSFCRDRMKTMRALKKAWSMFIHVLPQFIAILLLVGLMLTAVTPETIRRVIGAQSGFPGMVFAALLGAIALVPVLVAFPVAAGLLQSGAGAAQIAVFISTLTMVGIVTLPLEIKYLGRKAAVLRNMLSFLFAFGSAFIVGMVMT